MKNSLVLLSLILAGCSSVPPEIAPINNPPVLQVSPTSIEDTPKLDGKKMTIAVYSFTDKTGQRKPSDTTSNLSSAVTQGGEVWVIKALQDVGGGTWFEVVERVGMDHLIKERQLIRNTREVYEKN